MTERRRRPAGFTLVEVLVVVAILGVLFGLLMPALRRARTTAQQVRCAAILREWGQAFHLYADQYHGLLPHTGDHSCNPSTFWDRSYPLLPQDDSGYTDALPPLLGRPAWSSFADGQRPTGDIWQCPLAFAWPDASYGYTPSTIGFHSYAANEYLDKDNTVGIPPTSTAYPNFAPYPSYLRLPRAQNASVTLLMFETTLNPAAGFGQTQATSESCLAGLRSSENAESFSDRHPHAPGKLGGNLMMLDGHVEWADHLWDPGLGVNQIPPAGDRRWWPY